MLIYVLLIWGILGLCVSLLVLFFVLNVVSNGEIVKLSRLLCRGLARKLKSWRIRYYKELGLDEYDSDDIYESEDDTMETEVMELLPTDDEEEEYEKGDIEEGDNDKDTDTERVARGLYKRLNQSKGTGIILQMTQKPPEDEDDAPSS